MSQRLTASFLLSFLLCGSTVLVAAQPPPSDQNIQFDQILKDLDILTRQQLQSQAAIESTTLPTTTSTSSTSSLSKPATAIEDAIIKKKRIPTSLMKSSRLDSHSDRLQSASQNAFRLPPKYDPNRAPNESRRPRSRGKKPITVGINLTVLHVAIDRHENALHLDLEILENWKDRRLRKRKVAKNNVDDDDDEDNDDFNDFDDEDREHEQDGDHHYRARSRPKLDHYLLEAVWASKIWHPLSRLQGNAITLIPIVPINLSNQSLHESAASGSQSASLSLPQRSPSLDGALRQRLLEHDQTIHHLMVIANESVAMVSLALKIRVKIPLYECKRDDSSLYPFDKVDCALSIVNVIYDRRQLVYAWNHLNWLHNGYQTGEFYLRDLAGTISSESLLDLDKADHTPHSAMRIELRLRRQIGDYILNVYLLHLFLLALCVASFWISIEHVVIRMSLSIIVLIIIKFQTIQTLKDDRTLRIVSALSVWTFGLSCLVIMGLLAHILSYYSVQHKWNEKILNRLIVAKSKSPPPPSVVVSLTELNDQQHRSNVQPQADNDSSTTSNSNEITADQTNPISSRPAATATGKSTDFRATISDRMRKIRKNLLIRLNSIILRNAQRTSDGYDHVNLIDIFARFTLIAVDLLFVIVYFFAYVF